MPRCRVVIEIALGVALGIVLGVVILKFWKSILSFVALSVAAIVFVLYVMPKIKSAMASMDKESLVGAALVLGVVVLPTSVMKMYREWKQERATVAPPVAYLPIPEFDVSKWRKSEPRFRPLYGPLNEAQTAEGKSWLD
jgi:hypothetical protein